MFSSILSRTSRLHQFTASRLRFLPQRTTPIKFPATRHLSSSVCRANRYVRFSSEPGPESPFNFKRWDTQIKVGVVALGLCTTYYVMHLEQVPETGRWRFMDTSPAFEAKLAKASRAEIRAAYRDKVLPPDHILTRHVQRVVSRILASSNLGAIKTDQLTHIQPAHDGEFWNPDAEVQAHSNDGGSAGVAEREWDVVVINDNRVVNAAASPGIVFVFTGILPICKDEDGLAAVLAHEIGHVVARHIPEKVSSQKILFFFASLLEILGLDFGFGKLITSFLLELPNSRLQEREADMIGLRLMSKACYDPRAASQMFTRLGELEQKARRINVEFIQTHPLTEKRVKYLDEMLPEAFSILAANPECAGMQDQLQAFKNSVGFTDESVEGVLSS